MAEHKILSERELAEDLGLSPWSVRTLRLKSGLPHTRTHGRVLYRLDSVVRWFEQNEQSCGKQEEEPEQPGVIRRIR